MNFADTMADVGLVSGGYNAEQDAEKNRVWLEQQRAREQARQAAADADFQRQQAFLSDARTIMPQYLAGGPQGNPGDPGQTEIPAGDLDYSEDGSPRAAIAAKPGTDNLSGMYQALQASALKHGQLDSFNALKDKATKLHEEGVLDFVRAAARGAPPDELEDVFNKSGNVKLKSGSLQGDGNDGFTAVTTDGQPVSLVPKQIIESLLSPKDLVAHEDKSELNDVKRQAAQLVADSRNQATSSRLEAALEKVASANKVADARTALLDAQTELAKLKAGGGGVRTQKTPGEWNQFSREVRAIAQSQSTSVGDDGKPKIDRKSAVQLQSMAEQLARDDPENYPSAAQAVAAASDKLEELQKIRDGAQVQAEQEAGGQEFTSPKDRDKWVASRAGNLTKARQTIAAPASVAGGAPAPRAAPQAAPAAAGTVAKPASQADFDALPSGSLYLNPADGKTYRKN